MLFYLQLFNTKRQYLLQTTTNIVKQGVLQCIIIDF